jgi:exonuclease SbcC
MIPLRVSIKGFMSYRDEQVLSFDGAPLWVLLGPNGSGKSVVFDAITFALYGRHSRQQPRGQKHQDLINHQETSGCAVEFDFSVNGESYRARRTVPRNGTPTRSLSRLLPDGPPEQIPGTHKEQAFTAEIERLIGLEFNAFTSSVLLVQGQSERLLQEDPSGRYSILSQLIDLLPFQRLHEIANDRRKKYDHDVESVRKRLETLEQVTEGALAGAREKSREAEADFKAAQASGDKLMQLREQAKRWQGLVDELHSQQQKLDAARALLDREAEIRNSSMRYQNLVRVIGDLKNVVEHRSRLEVLTERVATLRAQHEQQQRELTAGEGEEHAAQQALDAASKEVRALRDEGEELLNRMIQLQATVTVLNRFEETETRLRDLEADLRQLPPDLPGICGEARKKQTVLQQAEATRPWLQLVADNRGRLAAACKDQREAAVTLSELDGKLEAATSRRDKLRQTLEALERRSNQLALAETRAKTLEEQIEQKRARFEEAADKAVCGLCGQAISADHAARERAELEAQLGEARSRLAALKVEIDAASGALATGSLEIAEIGTEISGVVTLHKETQRIRERAADQILGTVAQLQSAFRNLPKDEQSRISSGPTSDASGWLATVYPTDDDLRIVAARATEGKTFAKQVEDLELKLAEWQRIDTLRGATRAELDRLENSVDLDSARAARKEQNALEARHAEIQPKIATLSRDAEAIKVGLQQAGERVALCDKALRATESDLNSSVGTCEEVERTLQAAVDAVAPTHQQEAMSVTLETLRLKEEESEELVKYEALAMQLEQALDERERADARIAEIYAAIGTVDEGARRQPALLEQELSEAITLRDEADQRRKEAERALTGIEQLHKQREESEECLRKSERQLHLYGLLAQLLGPEGLQMYLLRRAERTIVAHANEILDGLSRGRLRLDFRGDDGETNQPKKALDLVVFDRDSGARATPVHLTSGSQRFRIAVSLALAIGRYAGQGARHIESVIIDEGFGSLDRDGRDDMIEQLNELQEQLQRIILVSHQEEFASAFSNGYRVELQDGASRISPQSWSE